MKRFSQGPIWWASLLGAVGLALLGTLPLGAGESWTLKEFVDGSDPLTAQNLFQGTASATTFPAPAEKPGWLTLGYLRTLWKWDRDTAVVGDGTVWLPSKGWGPGEKAFTRNLILFLKDQLAEKTGKNGPPDGLYDPEKAAFLCENFNLPTRLPDNPEFRLVQPFYRKGILSGRQQIQFKETGTPWTSVPQTLALTLRTYCAVPAAVQSMAAKSPIEDGDWSWQSKELALLPQDIWVPQEGTNLETLRSLTAGEVLRLGTNCKISLPVSRGDLVMVTIVKGSLAVEIPAQSLEDGRLGQKIRLRLDTGRNLDAEVSGSGTLREELP